MAQPSGWLRSLARQMASVRFLIGTTLALGALLPLSVALTPTPALAQSLTSSTLKVVGVEVRVDPANQSVPKGLTTTVNTSIVTPAASVPISQILVLLPSDSLVKAILCRAAPG